MTFHVRLWVACVAAIAIATLVLQTGVDLAAGDGLFGSLWAQARYFTNLTVLAVALIFGVQAVGGRWLHPGWSAAITVWIVLVGVVYHALLAATHHPEGWDVLVNISQHTVLPALVLLSWATIAPRQGLLPRHAVLWVAYPMGYAAYAIIRGVLDGKFPYFFLDPVKTGVPGVIGYVLGLGALFLLVGLLFVWLASRLRPRKTDEIPL